MPRTNAGEEVVSALRFDLQPRPAAGHLGKFELNPLKLICGDDRRMVSFVDLFAPLQFGYAFNICEPDSEEFVGVAKVMEFEKGR